MDNLTNHVEILNDDTKNVTTVKINGSEITHVNAYTVSQRADSGFATVTISFDTEVLSLR